MCIATCQRPTKILIVSEFLLLYTHTKKFNCTLTNFSILSALRYDCCQHTYIRMYTEGEKRQSIYSNKPGCIAFLFIFVCVVL